MRSHQLKQFQTLRGKNVLSFFQVVDGLTHASRIVPFLWVNPMSSKNMQVFEVYEIFGGHLLSGDDHSHRSPPYWNITKKTFSLGRTEVSI